MPVKKKSIVLLQGVFREPFFDLLRKRKIKEVFILEGRPGLEAARQSSRSLLKRGIKPVIITDNMAGFLFYKKLVKEIWLSYQTADKEGALCQIGGMILGVLGKKHKVPVNLYPNRGVRMLMGSNNDITHFNGVKVAPAGVKGYVPLMEWVPAKYFGAIYD